MSASPASSIAPLRPDWQRRYRVIRQIGSGGFATVYEAHDVDLGRRVALKVTEERRGLSARVAREVQAAAALGHPGIVCLYDVFTDGDHSFIVAELVEGEPVSRLIGQLDDAAAVEVARQILDALAHAHAQGVVHRDIKPANVMVTAEGTVKVMDFGIARLSGAETLTAEGDMLGTVAYMSPEQASGRRVGPPSDVYSAGVLLYELLSGENPAPAATPGERLGCISAGRLVPLDKHRPDLPPSLLDAVDAALGHDPSRRPSAADMAAALDAVLVSGELRRHRMRPAEVSRALALGERIVGAVLAGLAAWSLLAALPAYPPTWRLPLAIMAFVAWALLPAGGLAFLLGALAFPLFNVSVPVGAVYLIAALAALLLARGRPVTALWPVLALVVAPIYAALLAPLAAPVLGRVRGPLAAAWAGLGTCAYLVLAGVGGSPFTFFQPASGAAARIAHADGFVTALARIGAVLFSPEALLQAALWGGLAVALPLVLAQADRQRRLVGGGLMGAAVVLTYSLAPAAFGHAASPQGVVLTSLIAFLVTCGLAVRGVGRGVQEARTSA